MRERIIKSLSDVEAAMPKPESEKLLNVKYDYIAQMAFQVIEAQLDYKFRLDR